MVQRKQWNLSIFYVAMESKITMNDDMYPLHVKRQSKMIKVAPTNGKPNEEYVVDW